MNLAGHLLFKVDHNIKKFGARFFSEVDTRTPAWEMLSITTMAGPFGQMAIQLNPYRFNLNRVLNLLPQTIQSPIGTQKDKAGDITVDQNWLYICLADYNGQTNIWKRVKLLDWSE